MNLNLRSPGTDQDPEAERLGINTVLPGPSPSAWQSTPPRNPASSATTVLWVHGQNQEGVFLDQLLHLYCELKHSAMNEHEVIEQYRLFRPSLLLLEFSPDALLLATDIAASIRRAFPDVFIVAVGSISDASCALAALRSGVNEFIDSRAHRTDVESTLQRLIQGSNQALHQHCQGIALLGARSGLGVSTLAVNLSVQLQAQTAVQGNGFKAENKTILLDMGLPAQDTLLYLDIAPGFDFVEAVKNVQRLDMTLLQTALGQHASSHLNVLALPRDLAGIRSISHSDSGALLTRLRAFYPNQVLDLGGFTNFDFMVRATQQMEHIWVVCDQNIASVVATAMMVKSLVDRGLDISRMVLIVNRYQRSLALDPEQVAKKIGLPLLGVLPDRYVELTGNANLGRVLSEVRPKDSYVLAVKELITSLQPTAADVPTQGGDSGSKFKKMWKRLTHGE